MISSRVHAETPRSANSGTKPAPKSGRPSAYFSTERCQASSSWPAYDLAGVHPFAPGEAGSQLHPKPIMLRPIQAKLEVGAVDDPLEHEADRVAEHVMRMPEPAAATSRFSTSASRIQRKCSCGGTCDKCKAGQDEEHEAIQRKPATRGGSGPIPATSAVHNVLHSPGQQLDPAARAFFEPRFGFDFSHVRVHADPTAAASARALGARAYTVGHQIVLGSEPYAPTSAEGARVLAHELTHVVQQSNASRNGTLRRAPAAQPEVKADPGATCSLKQHQHIAPAAFKANEWLAITLGAINSFLNGAKTQGAQTAAAVLMKHFHSTDRNVVSYVRDRLKTIQNDLFGRKNFRVNCPPASDHECGTKHGTEEYVAVVPTPGNPNEINLCQPFFERGVDDCASTIIHEFGHTQLGLSQKQEIVDRGYKWDAYYPYLTTGEALTNGESYAMLAREIATGSSPAPGPISDDIGKSCPKDWVPLIMDAMAKARAWNHRAAINTSKDHEFSLAYKKMDGKLTSEIAFKCILDKGYHDRCVEGTAYWLYAGDLRICANWRGITSPEDRAIEMLTALYGYKGVMDDSAGATEKRRRAAREARRLHAANVPSAADVLSGK